MPFNLNDFIEEYIGKALTVRDRNTAGHLKKIIPDTNHLRDETFEKIMENLKKCYLKGMDFRSAFETVAKKYELKGDEITAPLPSIFFRIITNVDRFLAGLTLKEGYTPEVLKQEFIMEGTGDFLEDYDYLQLALPSKRASFATFDEQFKGRDPFSGYTVKEIVDMMALDGDAFDEEDDREWTAFKIIYKNKKHFKKHFPTFCDAGWYGFFFPAGKGDDYGRTRSRKTGSPGMAEVVHKNVRINDVVITMDYLND